MESKSKISQQSPYVRVPPQSVEAEMALLGSVMLRPDAIYEITDQIKPDSFYAERHRIIFRTMLELFSATIPIDLLSLSNRLRERGELEHVGGAGYLTELVNAVPSASNIKHYAEIIEKKYVMRNLIACSEDINRLGYSESDDLETLLDSAEKRVFEVTNAPTSHRFVMLGDELAAAWERFDKLHQSREEIRGVPTGFKDLDSKLAGLQNSDLVILAARPSVGKTSLALDIVRNAAIIHNIPVGIFSLEMSSQQIVDRMLAAESRVDSWKLRTGHGFVEHDFSALQRVF